MKRTFQTEDNRKDKLFEAWIAHLDDLQSQTHDSNFDEIYEGLAEVSKLSGAHMCVQLEDRKKMLYIPITSEISKLSIKSDSMYIVIGRKGSKWFPLDVISIGSLIDQEKFHMTLNPEIMEPTRDVQ